MERGTFDQAAEFLFGNPLQLAVFGVRVGQGFVCDAEALPGHDAEICVTLAPDLALFQFHGFLYDPPPDLATAIFAWRIPQSRGLRKLAWRAPP